MLRSVLGSLWRPSTEKSARCKYLGRVVLGGSVLWCAAIAACYTWRLDAWAAVTVFPIWVWVLGGLTIIATARSCAGRRATVAVASAWCVVLFAFADHPTSLLWWPGGASDRTVRIVSLNCAGSSAAVREIVEMQPDIVLVQESPGREPLASLAHELFGDEGHVLSGVDASLVARGEITPLSIPTSVVSNAVRARIKIADKIEVEVVSLRLEPPLVRVDLWSPDCWREQAANRRRRRKQLEAIVAAIEPASSDFPLIVGGDFNAPPRDAVFDELRPLHDAFGEAGRGWGNSIINSAPFLRIDQIWLSSQLHATGVYCSKTEHSDHRMLICDVLPPKP